MVIQVTVTSIVTVTLQGKYSGRPPRDGLPLIILFRIFNCVFFTKAQLKTGGIITEAGLIKVEACP